MSIKDGKIKVYVTTTQHSTKKILNRENCQFEAMARSQVNAIALIRCPLLKWKAMGQHYHYLLSESNKIKTIKFSNT
jgi:REP element-mobilizing transposase RayT